MSMQRTDEALMVAVREGDLDQLEEIAGSYPTRGSFLTELTLDPPSATSDEAGVALLDEDYLILSTIHSAKGQEWRSVFILNCVDGCIPSDLAAESTPEIEEIEVTQRASDPHSKKSSARSCRCHRCAPSCGR